MPYLKTPLWYLLIPLVGLIGCSDSDNNSPGATGNTPLGENAIYEVANGCYAITPDGGDNFIGIFPFFSTIPLEEPPEYGFVPSADDIFSQFLLRPSDLGKYLLYDEGGGYMTSDGQKLQHQSTLASDTRLVDGEILIEDRMQSEGEWQLHAADDGRFRLQHIKSNRPRGSDGR